MHPPWQSIVDLTDADNLDDHSLVAIAEKIDYACRTDSMFLLLDRSLSIDLIAKVRQDLRLFFQMPLEYKLALHRRDSGLGYLPEKAESLGATLGSDAQPDPKETFNIGPDQIRNRWPPDMNDFQDEFLSYYREMWRISTKLMRVISISFELAPDFLVKQSISGNSILRATRYPPLTPLPPDGTQRLRAGAHTDYGLFSLLLLDDEVGGYEIRPPEGAWKEVVPIANVLAVNIGDLLMRMTNGVWAATMHRVTVSEAYAGKDRLSLVFLHNPNPDALIAPLAGFYSTEEEPLFSPVVARDYLKAKSAAGLKRP